ncbi:protein phosphatase 2C domain-containing protein [Flammeovirga aprica]|uniref:Protein phosphatase 2C domain-containing protein n=1 Tax=Flammeovirga aprica JL-4 TaxID=694437 RepID=A0A7X9S2F7_9BACT|nr:protein phosphatase 2C domain-containing protein [Flammeovirga aprica]NME72952.1 protein phosphatase 2C domain-containing protein [Flammeovirga aprica JL-4]
MMIQTISKRGHLHENNEDALYHCILYDRFIVSAVMDGCSSAVESQFTSLLFKKILHKSCNRLVLHHNNLDGGSAEFVGKELMHSFFTQLQLAQKLLQLNYDELASTLLLNVIDKEAKSCVTYCSGDGLFAVDNIWKKIDQNNVPDFLCYHLQGSFQNWFNNHVEQFQHNVNQSVVITTDGIDSFDKPVDYQKVDYNYINNLCSKKHHRDDISMIFIQI